MDGDREADQETLDLSDLEPDRSGAQPIDSSETSPGPSPAPFGPRRDPVFPSLPADHTPEPVRPEPETVGAAAIPLIRNVFTLQGLSWGISRAGFLSQAIDADPAATDVPTELDLPERERVATVAADFVQNHVRRLDRGAAIKTPHENFAVGTLLVSENHVPQSRRRHGEFQWAITAGRVVELHNVRLPVGHLRQLETTVRTDFGRSCHGDLNDLAFFTANLLDMLQVDARQPIGAIGDINFHENSVATVSRIDDYLDAARVDRMHDLLLPQGNGKMSAMHGDVRYWSVRDTNEAAFATLAALSGEVVVPNLVRRALTKRAYSWAALAFAVLAVLGFQLAAALGSRPPVTFLRYLLLVVVVFLVGSAVFTHRYWRMDR